jgi:hypothetical protein
MAVPHYGGHREHGGNFVTARRIQWGERHEDEPCQKSIPLASHLRIRQRTVEAFSGWACCASFASVGSQLISLPAIG